MGISISEASRNWGISRTTIHSKINQKLLSKDENGLIDPSEMNRVFGSPKKKQNTVNSLHNTDQGTSLNSQILLLEQALKFEQERTKDLQNRLQVQEQQIYDLLQTIKDLSQSIKLLEAPKKRKKILGFF